MGRFPTAKRHLRYAIRWTGRVHSLWITGVHNGNPPVGGRYHSTLKPKFGRKPTLSTVRRLSGSDGSSVYA